jgi:DNA-binding response OmpR family regulator
MSKVLVIEDNIEISENIVEILELADYDVLWPKMAKQGVEMADEFTRYYSL